MIRISLVLGLLAGAAVFGNPATPASAATVEIAVGDFYFCDPSFQNGVCETPIDVGDSVLWDFGPTQPLTFHTTTDCGADCDSPTAMPLWDSGLVQGSSEPFEFTFDTPGLYTYYCEVHPFSMRGVIIVQGEAGGPGDVNCDGGANAIDAALLLQLDAAFIEDVPCPAGGDVNNDGAMNSLDAALVLQFDASIIPSLPV